MQVIRHLFQKIYRPPDPGIKYDDEIHLLLSNADRNLARLDGIITVLPNPDLFIAMYVKKEALLSSQIEGTQVSLEGVLEFEADFKPKEDISKLPAAKAALAYENKNP